MVYIIDLPGLHQKIQPTILFVEFNRVIDQRFNQQSKLFGIGIQRGQTIKAGFILVDFVLSYFCWRLIRKKIGQ